MHSWSAATRWRIIAAICVTAVAVVAFLDPIPQPQAYHQFADQRAVAGIPHGLDVLSNLSFLASGLLGLWFVMKTGPTLDAGTRWALATLFFGLVLTSVGSAYYHLEPDNQRLVFDRLPMIIAMSGCVGALLADRFGGATAWSIAALLGIGLWTVHYWSAGEELGHGDLRWYALYQGLVIVVSALLLCLFTMLFAGNVLAKVFELLDKPIYGISGIVSGHTLKHLSAGLAFLPLVFLVRRMGKGRILYDSVQDNLAAAVVKR
jgi:hypothetical protein